MIFGKKHYIFFYVLIYIDYSQIDKYYWTAARLYSTLASHIITCYNFNYGKLSCMVFFRSFGKHIGCTDMEAMTECLKTKSTMQIVNASTLVTEFLFSPVI
jgi:hypothetical protein